MFIGAGSIDLAQVRNFLGFLVFEQTKGSQTIHPSRQFSLEAAVEADFRGCVGGGAPHIFPKFQKMVESYVSKKRPKSIFLDSGHLDNPFGPLIF